LFVFTGVWPVELACAFRVTVAPAAASRMTLLVISSPLLVLPRVLLRM